jgi:hypothetical protein
VKGERRWANEEAVDLQPEIKQPLLRERRRWCSRREDRGIMKVSIRIAVTMGGPVGYR